MTIKRRLYISNVLMLIIPVIMTIVVIVGIFIALWNFIGGGNAFSSYEHHYDAIDHVETLAEQWREENTLAGVTETDVSKDVTSAIDKFGRRYGKYGMTLSLYHQGNPVYSSGEFLDHDIMRSVLADRLNQSYEIDNAGLYAQTLGDYKLVMVNSDYEPVGKKIKRPNGRTLANAGGLLLLVVVGAILLTNVILTRMVIKSIMTPLNTLVYGVRQIRDGNLDYRIHYYKKDEFGPVCEDFNEMACRLHDMVAAQQQSDESRRELIAGISHDLRTPLTSIKAYVEGLEQGVARTPEKKQQYLDTVRGKTEDMEHIVNQLFLFSKLDLDEFPLRMETVESGAFLQEFVTGIADEYRARGLDIRLASDTTTALLQLDRVQIGNVMINIAENTLKYGGPAKKTLDISCVQSGDAVALTLADNGPGVEESALPKLFSVFYRNDKARSNVRQGSGLGLAISAKIVERHGGKIQAHNRPGGGLAITMTLPVQEEEA